MGKPGVIDHPRAAAHAHTTAFPAHFAQTARNRNHITGQRVVADKNDERLALGIAPDALHHSLQDRRFK